jgi:hypothetical protein
MLSSVEGRAADPRECLSPDVFVLGAGGHAAVIALIGVLPEAHGHVPPGGGCWQ